MDSLPSSSYVTDTLGDVESAKYGGASQSKVPRFRRRGAGHVLGLDRGLKIAPGSDGHSVEILPGGKKRVRYTESTFSRASSTSKGSRLKARAIEKAKAPLPDYLPLGNTHRGRTELDDAPTEYLGHLFAGTDRNNPRKGKEKESISSEDDAEEESDEDVISSKDEMQERLQDLNSKIRADPGDITSWLALVAIQEEILAQTQQYEHDSKVFTASRSKRENIAQFRRSVAEVQLAVIERAIREHQSNASSLPLLKARLELASSSGTWTIRQVEKEWRAAIASLSPSRSLWSSHFDLWKGFLSWKLGNNNDHFLLQQILNTFAEALQSLRSHFFSDTDGPSDERQRQEHDLLDLFEQIAELMLDAGFVERARGLLQAQSELCIHLGTGPSRVDTRETFRLACRNLEDYWDLQEHRIGEKDSIGWKMFRERVAKGDKSICEPPQKREDLVTFGSVPDGLNDPDPIRRWLALENARASLRTLPAKWGDEADWQTGELEVDPFSIVLFSDVEPFLVPVSAPSGRERIAFLFLSSMGLSKGATSERQLLQPERFWPSQLSTPSSSPTWELIGGEMMPRPKVSALGDPFKMPIKRWPSSVDDLFAMHSQDALHWFVAWEDVGKIEKKNLEICMTFLEQASAFSTQLSLSRLALSAATQKHKTTTRMAKEMLSRDRQSIDLWRAYARLERTNANHDSARTVYKSLLSASRGGTRPSLTCVWADWAELEWENGQHRSAVNILVQAGNAEFCSVDNLSIFEEMPVSAMDILRTRRALRREMTIHTNEENAVFCAALFQYLTDNEDEAFDSAMKLFDEALKSCHDEEVGQQSEKLAMKHCKFIWRHVSGKSKTQRSRRYIPRNVTARLTEYVLRFPHNSAFVSLLAAFEMTTKVENVLRKVLEEKVAASSATIEADWLVYIYCELHMNLNLINENAVRRLFERALDTKCLPLSSLLWQLYLQFETQISQRLTIIAQESRQRFDTEPDREQAVRETLKERFKADQRRSHTANLRAKAVLYRAIDKVPYCKALYLSAFDLPLRSAFSNDELLQLFHLMQERQVRYFTSLDAFLDSPPSPTTSPSSSHSESRYHHKMIE